MTPLGLYIKWGGIAAAVLGWSWLCYHQGSLAPQLAEAKKELKVDARADAKRATDSKTVAEEAKTYEAATDPLKPVDAPHVSVCYYAPAAAPVPAARAPGSGTAAPTPLPTATPPTPVSGPDIGRPSVQVGRDADAQVVGLLDYIERVCQAK